MSNGDTTTIVDKTLNVTRVGGISALVVSGLSAVVPVVEQLSSSKIDTPVVVGMEGLAAVLAIVAAWIYTIDVRTRTELTRTRLIAEQAKARPGTPSLPPGGPLEVTLRSHPKQTESVLAIRLRPDTDETELLVAEHGAEPRWEPISSVLVQ